MKSSGGGSSAAPRYQEVAPLLSDAAPPFATLPDMAQTMPAVSSGGVVNNGHRAKQDVGWGRAYLLSLLLVFILGAVAASHANPDYDVLTAPSSLAAYGTCHATSRSLLEGDNISAAHKTLNGYATNTLVLAFFASFGLGFAFLGLLRRNARACVRAACGIQVLAPAVVGTGLLVAGQTGTGLFFYLMAALSALVFHLWRAQLELVGRLLTVAAAALNENGHLVSATLALQLLLTVVAVPVVVMIVFAARTGAPAPNAAVASVSAPGGAASTCASASGESVPCCVWQPSAPAILYIVAAASVLSWTTFLAFEARLFAIAHVVARWYESPAGVALPGKPVREALSLAAGPSFGSLSKGAAVLTAADALRQAADSARRNNDGLLSCLVASLAACVAALLEYLTKFATVRLAITGESFMDAARGATALLRRNFLNSYGVWAFPPMVLQMTSLAVALAYGAASALVFAIAGEGVAVAAGPSGSPAALDASASLRSLVVLVGVGSGLIALLVLAFLNSIVLNVIDVVYLLWAMDVDRHMVSKPEVHLVFASMPMVRTPGSIVAQPDGEVGYAPANQQQQQPAPGGAYRAPPQARGM